MSRTWPADWDDRMRGADCGMCGEARPEELKGGSRIFAGEVSDAHLRREGWSRAASRHRDRAGVRGYAEPPNAFALVAHHASPTGVGLHVHGRSQFDTVGTGTIAANADAATVVDARATPASHVGVELTSDPDAKRATVQWVARAAGAFTVHLTDKVHIATTFTYFIVDPA